MLGYRTSKIFFPSLIHDTDILIMLCFCSAIQNMQVILIRAKAIFIGLNYKGNKFQMRHLDLQGKITGNHTQVANQIITKKKIAVVTQ